MKRSFIIAILLVFGLSARSQKTGNLFVNCEPQTKIYIDDDLKGISENSIGFMIHNLPIGKHVLKASKEGYARKDGYGTWFDTLQIEENKTLEVRVELFKREYHVYTYKEGVYAAKTGLEGQTNGITSKRTCTYAILILQPWTENGGDVILYSLNWWLKPPRGEKSVEQAIIATVKDLFGNNFTMEKYNDLLWGDNIVAKGKYKIDDHSISISFYHFKGVFYADDDEVHGFASINSKLDLYSGFDMPFFYKGKPAYALDGGSQLFISLRYQDY